jgi:glucose/arabinose dehydrogenase
MISPDSPEVWGRPVSALEMPDGSLLVSEDGANKVWRISYGK